ncbi:MAG: acyltransferase [Chitinophagaceae bacterium]|nr:MAG: acyltransferase [Chitinophagaceae bacterium]
MKYNPQLDGLRCLAILLVFLGHTIPNARVAVPLIGLAGVDLFFAISGFLITSILLNTEGDFSGAYKRFIGMRTLRIFPVYYLTIALLFLAQDEYLEGKLTYLLTYT